MKKLLAAMLAMAMLLSAAALAEPEAVETGAVETGAVEPETVETDTDGVTGVWYMREMILEDGVKLNPDAMGMEFTIELVKDGAAIMTDTRGAYQQVDKGVWSQEGSMVSIVVNDDFSILLRQEGDALTAERAESHSKWVFRREVPDDIFELAPAVAAELEDYAGHWTVIKIQVAGLYYDADMLGANPGAIITGDTLTLSGGMPFGKVPVTLQFADGALAHAGLETEPEVIVTPTPEATPTPMIEPSPTPTPTFAPTPTPTPEITPTPEPEIVYGDESENGAVFVATAEPTPSPTPTMEPTPSPTPTHEPTPSPTPEATPTPSPTPTIEPRLRTSRYDITAQLLEDGKLSLTVGLDSETLVVFILRRGY